MQEQEYEHYPGYGSNIWAEEDDASDINWQKENIMDWTSFLQDGGGIKKSAEDIPLAAKKYWLTVNTYGWVSTIFSRFIFSSLARVKGSPLESPDFAFLGVVRFRFRAGDTTPEKFDDMENLDLVEHCGKKKYFVFIRFQFAFDEHEEVCVLSWEKTGNVLDGLTRATGGMTLFLPTVASNDSVKESVILECVGQVAQDMISYAPCLQSWPVANTVVIRLPADIGRDNNAWTPFYVLLRAANWSVEDFQTLLDKYTDDVSSDKRRTKLLLELKGAMYLTFQNLGVLLLKCIRHVLLGSHDSNERRNIRQVFTDDADVSLKEIYLKYFDKNAIDRTPGTDDFVSLLSFIEQDCAVSLSDLSWVSTVMRRPKPSKGVTRLDEGSGAGVVEGGGMGPLPLGEVGVWDDPLPAVWRRFKPTTANPKVPLYKF